VIGVTWHFWIYQIEGKSGSSVPSIIGVHQNTLFKIYLL
jgi:hypothetical protein